MRRGIAPGSTLLKKLFMLGRAKFLIEVKKISVRAKRIDVKNTESWRELIET